MDRRTALLAGGAALVLPHGALRAQAFPSHSITLYLRLPGRRPDRPGDARVCRGRGARAEAGGRRREQAGRRRHSRADGTEDCEARRLHCCRRFRSASSAFPHMQKAPQIDPLKDFTYIVNLTGYTFGLVVPANAPWKTLKEYVDDAKKNPGKIDYGSTGTGTTPHLAMEEFSQKAGIKLTHVPYKGSAELMAAVLGGHLMSVSDSTGFAPQVEAGKLRLLATFGSKRTKRWPDVPTLNELGYDTISDSPFGIAGPAGMDAATVKVLHDAFKKALDDPKVLGMLERYDQPVIYMSSEEYTKYARQTFEAEKATIDRLGLRGSM